MKFALLLPVLQLAIAVGLLEWGYRAPRPFPPHGDELYVPTARLICQGVNAPAGAAAILLGAIPTPEVKVFLLTTNDLEFLAAVILAWYLAGKMIDGRTAAQKCGSSGGSFATNVGNAFFMLVGALLLIMALGPLRSPGRYNNPTGNITEGILFLAWSFALVAFPVLQLFRGWRSL